MLMITLQLLSLSCIIVIFYRDVRLKCNWLFIQMFIVLHFGKHVAVTMMHKTWCLLKLSCLKGILHGWYNGTSEWAGKVWPFVKLFYLLKINLHITTVVSLCCTNVFVNLIVAVIFTVITLFVFLVIDLFSMCTAVVDFVVITTAANNFFNSVNLTGLYWCWQRFAHLTPANKWNAVYISLISVNFCICVCLWWKWGRHEQWHTWSAGIHMYQCIASGVTAIYFFVFD